MADIESPEQLGDLMYHYLRNDLSAAQKEILDQWLNASEERRKKFSQYISPENTLRELAGVYEINSPEQQQRMDALFNQALNRSRPVPVLRKRILQTLVAASMLGLLLTGIYVWNKPDIIVSRDTVAMPNRLNLPPPVGKAILTLADGRIVELDSTKSGTITQENGLAISSTAGILQYADQHTAQPRDLTAINVLTTPRGGRYQLVLPDGTRVWLNSASSIKYPVVFTAANRTVELTGEAYFEVKENKTSPFLVKLDNEASIQVLGTSFNVMAYQDENDIQTTLINGAVKVVRGKNINLLQPGEASVLSTDGTLSVNKEVDVDQVIAWKNGFLVFDNAGLDLIMRKISRNYDVDIIFKGAITTRHYTGGVRNSANIEQVLSKLELAGGVSFSIEGRKIFVKTK